MSYLDWKVGDRVVCLKHVNPSVRVPRGNYPECGGVYAIREIRDDNHSDGHLTILLVGIDNRHLIGVRRGNTYGYKEPGFPIHGFRKIDPRATDISIFTAMLHGQHDKVPA